MAKPQPADPSFISQQRVLLESRASILVFEAFQYTFKPTNGLFCNRFGRMWHVMDVQKYG